MKTTDRIFVTALLLLCMLSALALPALAEDDVVSGTWGSLTWTLNQTTGELVISGEGEMDSFSSSVSSEAWRKNELAIKTVVIEPGVTSIAPLAFYMCINLTSVTVSNSVTSIGDNAFAYCSKLASVTLSASQMSIGKRAFASCLGLTSIVIPKGVVSIGAFAFSDCSSMARVTVSDSVTSIGEYAFGGCMGLASIYFCGTEAQWSGISGAFPSKATKRFGHCWGEGFCEACGETLRTADATTAVGNGGNGGADNGDDNDGCNGAVSGKLVVLLFAVSAISCVLTAKKKKK